jgi:hypothetical protein
VGNHVAADQGGQVWHADEGQCGSQTATQYGSFAHFRPGRQLSFDLERIDVDQAGGFPSVPDSVELKGSDTALAHMANKARLFKSFPGRDLMGCHASNGVALGDNPASATTGSHQANVEVTFCIDQEWQGGNLVHRIIPIIQATQNL